MAPEEQKIIVWDDKGNVVYEDSWTEDNDDEEDDD